MSDRIPMTQAGYDKLAEHVMDADAAAVIGELGDDDTSVAYGKGVGPDGAGAFVAAEVAAVGDVSGDDSDSDVASADAADDTAADDTGSSS